MRIRVMLPSGLTTEALRQLLARLLVIALGTLVIFSGTTTGSRALAATASEAAPAASAAGCGLPEARAQLDALVTANGITTGLEQRITQALESFELLFQQPKKLSTAFSHLDRAVHLLLWQVDVIMTGKVNQGDPAGLSALAACIDDMRNHALSCAPVSWFPGTHPHGWTIGGYGFFVYDFVGAPELSIVDPWGNDPGLWVGWSTSIRLPVPASAVDITLGRWAAPVTVYAYDASGSTVDQETMVVDQGVWETLHLAGDIHSLGVVAPNDEALMLELCSS